MLSGMGWLIPLSGVLRRELLSSLRRQSMFALMLLTVVWCGLSFTTFSLRSSGNSNAEIVLMSLAYTLDIASLFLITPVAAVAIAREREQDTWDLVQITPVRAWQFVLGKLLSVLGVYTLILVAVLPLFGIAFFFVGMDYAEFGWLILRLLTITTMQACIGLVFSSMAIRTTRAIMAALVCAVIARGCTSVVPGAAYGTWFAGESLVAIVVAGFAFLWAVFELHRVVHQQRANVSSIGRTAHTQPSGPGRHWRSGGDCGEVADWMNPVFGRERIIQRNMSRTIDRYATLGLFLLWILLALLIGFSSDLSWETVRFSGAHAGALHAFVGFQAFLVCLLAPVFPLAHFRRDQEESTREFLRMTLLRPREIMAGLVQGACWRMGPLVIAACGGTGVLALLLLGNGPWLVLYWLGACAMLLVLTLLVLSIALVAAVCAKTALAAVVLTYLCVFVLYALVPALLRLQGLPTWLLWPPGALQAAVDEHVLVLPINLILSVELSVCLVMLAAEVFERVKLRER